MVLSSVSSQSRHMMAPQSRRLRAAPVRVLVGAALVLLGALRCAADSAAVSPAPTTAMGHAAVRQEAAPAAAAPADATTPVSDWSLEDEHDDPENETEASDGRQGRFLHWTSVSRGDPHGPHPTMATFSQRASQLGDILRRAAKFLSAFASAQEDDAASNEVDVDEAQRKEGEEAGAEHPADDTPGAALSGLYSECLMRLSVPCVQRKLLLFLDRLGRMERFRLLGDFLTVVRVEPRSGEGRRNILDEDADVTDLAGMVDRLVDDFFETHVLRFSLPGTLRVGRSPKTTVDIHLDRPDGAHGEDDDEDDQEQGRALQHGAVEPRGSFSFGGGKGGGGGGGSKKKQKMIKKIKKKLMKLLMMLMSVMMVMGPMTGGMAGNTAGMALMLGTLALIILKAMAIKQMGGSVTQLLGNVGNSFGGLAGIPGLPGSQGQGTNYLPSGTGGGPYARSDYVYPPYTTWAGAGRSAGGGGGGGVADYASWFSGLGDPMTLAYRAYAIATQLK